LKAFKQPEFKMNIKALRLFLKEIKVLCSLVNIPIVDKSYRSKCNYRMLSMTVRSLPQSVTNDISTSGDLPTGGFLSVTLLATLSDINWEFQFNSRTYKLCDCHTQLRGIAKGQCVTPADESQRSRNLDVKIANAVVGFAKNEKMAATGGAAGGVGGGGGARGLANSSRVVAAKGRPVEFPVDSTGEGQLSSRAPELTSHAAVWKAVAALRLEERHFPERLRDLASALRNRVDDLRKTVMPVLVQEFYALPTPPAARPRPNSQGWTRFLQNLTDQVIMFDSCYTEFEELYIRLATAMLEGVLAPVNRLTEQSNFLVKCPNDPYTDVQAAVLCQRLGLLKRRVDFGGPYQIREFDPSLLIKARRIPSMDTFDEVRDMASRLLTCFSSLCRVLNDIRIDQIRFELSDNPELSAQVLELEKAWAECQFVLRQDSLDMTRQLLDLLPQLSASARWQLRTAMSSSPIEDCTALTSQASQKQVVMLTRRCTAPRLAAITDASDGDLARSTSTPSKQSPRELSKPTFFTEVPSTKIQDQSLQPTVQLENTIEAQEGARLMLFQTLPLLVYLDELWYEVCLDRLWFRLHTLDKHSSMRDQDQFAEDLLDAFREYMVPRQVVSQLKVQLRGTPLVAEVHGSISTMQELRKMLPKHQSIEVRGAAVTVMEAPKTSYYRDSFCTKDDRHHTLRRDFAKFELGKCQKFRSFVLGEETMEQSIGKSPKDAARRKEEEDRWKHFKNLYRQLKEVAAFPTDTAPMNVVYEATSAEVMEDCMIGEAGSKKKRRPSVTHEEYVALQARARWVCAQRVAQTVEPELFPENPPDDFYAHADYLRRNTVAANASSVLERRDKPHGGRTPSP
jgi:hypothetical protein